MLKNKILSILLLAFLSLPGCALFQAYKVTVQQGNVITQRIVDRLRIGMTREQVEFVAGKPLIDNIFHPDRWDYVQYIQHRGKRIGQAHLTVFFDAEGKLERMEGDFQFARQSAPPDVIEPLPVTTDSDAPDKVRDHRG